MNKVGIIGAGIGGSYLSYFLGKAGIDTIVFDFRVPHEKLCGGGITFKAMERFPVLNELPCPRKKIWKSVIISPTGRSVTINMKRPLTMINRRDLDSFLLEKALGLGVCFRKERVQDFIPEENHWRIFTKAGDYRAEILVGADGALSGTRRKLCNKSLNREAFFALQCFLDVQEDVAIWKLLPDLMGYLWAFPRVDNLAVGIVSKDYGARGLREMERRLLHFIERNYPGKAEIPPVRGAYIPFFCAINPQDITLCARNWALIGDAAKFVDPISGEGIYYAIHSAEILGECILEDDLYGYQQLCMKSFGENLFKATQIFENFYRAEFIETMIAVAEASLSARRIISDMISGGIDYITWMRRLRNEFFGISGDFALNSDFSTKKEVIIDLVKLFPDYFMRYFKDRIS